MKKICILFVVACLAAGLVGCNGGVPSVAAQGAAASGSSQGLAAMSQPPARKKAMMEHKMEMESKANSNAALQAGSRLTH